MSTFAAMADDAVRVVLEPQGAELEHLLDAVCDLDCAHLVRAGGRAFVFVPHDAAFRLTAKAIFIYALIDPETQNIRYVGKSIRPRARLTNHLNERSQCYRTHWLQSLRRSHPSAPHLRGVAAPRVRSPSARLRQSSRRLQSVAAARGPGSLRTRRRVPELREIRPRLVSVRLEQQPAREDAPRRARA